MTIVVLGLSCSGKSTFSNKLGKLLNLEVFHLDSYYWESPWIVDKTFDINDFVEKEKIIDCNISAVFTAPETGFSSDVEANGCELGILYAIMGIVIDVARRHKISPLALCMGLMSILLNDEKMTKDLKDNKEDSLFEILKKMNKEFMN